MVRRDFILPEPASYVFFYAVFNLRNLLYTILIVHYPYCTLSTTPLSLGNLGNTQTLFKVQ